MISFRHLILSLWVIKPLGEDSTPATVKPLPVSLVEPVAYRFSYFIPAPHVYLFSKTGLVYRAYDEIRVPGGDIRRFDFDYAQRSNPTNCGRYTISDGKLYIKMGRDPVIVTAVPNGGAVIIDSVTYTRQ